MRTKPNHAVQVSTLEQTIKLQKVPRDARVHAVEGSLDLRLEEGVKFFEEGLQMGEIVMQQVRILEAVVLGEILVHAKGAQRTKTCIGREIPR